MLCLRPGACALWGEFKLLITVSLCKWNDKGYLQWVFSVGLEEELILLGVEWVNNKASAFEESSHRIEE